MSAQTSSVVVPDELRKQFPDLIALILGSESMNDEERQYWINILPAMTPEQRKNLQDILKNEKDQLAAIDAKYTKEVEAQGSVQAVEEAATDRKNKREKRGEAEGGAEAEEKRKEEEILKAIEEMG